MEKVVFRNVFILSSCIFLLFSFLSFVNATDVAYIVKDVYHIEPAFTNVLNEFALTYDIIYHINLSTTNFSKYKFMLLDDEIIDNPSLIPVNNFPAVLVNGRNMDDWGWTKYISRTSQTEMFRVDIVNFSTGITNYINKTEIQIYNEIDPDIYNMRPDNRYSGMTVVASKKHDANDAVVAVAGPNSVLTYPGRPNTYVNAKTCFFGIFEADYWTNDTKNLFKGCVSYVAVTCSQDADCNDNNVNTLDTCHNPGTVQSYCTNEPIRCYSDSDCGINFNGNNYCFSGNVFRDSTSFTCNNPGQTSSYCSNTTSPILVDSCTKGCSNGVCLLAHNLAFMDNYDGLGNKIRVRDPNNTNMNNPLTITEKGEYDIGFKIINNGDYAESGNVNCRIENSSTLIYSWSSAINLNAGAETTTGSKDNYDLSLYNNGNYVIKCNLTSPLDETPSDNYAERSFTINYPNIACSLDSDCGVDGFTGSNFCIGKNVTRNYIDYTCNNKGLPSSYCSNNQTASLIQPCSDYCLGGECKDFVCEQDSECNDYNTLTYDQCINPRTANSECRNTPINCASDQDCGFTGNLGLEYCSRDNVFKNNQQSLCRNAGTLNSYCTLRITATKTDECEFACLLGACIVCDENSDCDDGNSLTQDICREPGTLGSYCDNNEVDIPCNSNNDCGSISSSLSCNLNNLVNITIIPLCNNPGEESSYCSNSTITSPTICSFGCNPISLICNPAQCSNQIDDDSDGLVDTNDPGCHSDGNSSNTGSYNPNDNNETNIIILVCVDNDQDGYDICNPGQPGDDGNPSDCNDNNAAVHPGAVEVCNGIDNDCDGQTDEGGVCQIQVCGNGVIEGSEVCDDGNLNNNDACSSSCEVQCPSQCNPHTCNPYNCNPFQCNPHQCNCRQICYWDVCNTDCDTCFDTCYQTCYQTCYDTCWGECTTN